MYLSERQRVELAIPARIMHSVVFSGADTTDDASRAVAEQMIVLLNRTCMEPLDGLWPREQAKIARRIERTFNEVMRPYKDTTAGKVGLITYYLLEALIERNILTLYHDSAMAEAVRIFQPYWEEVASIRAVDDSAKKQAGKLLAHLQSMGYYRT